MKLDITKLPKSVIKVKVEVPTDEFEAYRKDGFKKVQEMVEVDGFRKGKATEDAIIKKFGEMTILEEMANIAVNDSFIKLMNENKIIPVTQPKITITKIAKGNDLEFTMTIDVLPDIKLPEYKKLIKEVEKTDEKIVVTDEDIENVLKELQKGRATEHSHIHDENETHNHEHTEDGKIIPSIDDEFAKSFGDDFQNLQELKNKVSENLHLEKEQKNREKRRTNILEKLIGETPTDLPEAIIENEISRMIHQMKEDITRFGGTWEEYLKHTNKTEDDIKKDWRGDAVKRAISQILLNKIAEAEKIVPSEEDVEAELIRLLATVQDADEHRAKEYVTQGLSNEKVLKFLEGEIK